MDLQDKVMKSIQGYAGRLDATLKLKDGQGDEGALVALSISLKAVAEALAAHLVADLGLKQEWGIRHWHHGPSVVNPEAPPTWVVTGITDIAESYSAVAQEAEFRKEQGWWQDSDRSREEIVDHVYTDWQPTVEPKIDDPDLVALAARDG